MPYFGSPSDHLSIPFQAVGLYGVTLTSEAITGFPKDKRLLTFKFSECQGELGIMRSSLFPYDQRGGKGRREGDLMDSLETGPLQPLSQFSKRVAPSLFGGQ